MGSLLKTISEAASVGNILLTVHGEILLYSVLKGDTTDVFLFGGKNLIRFYK